jgi:hypothetical protein
MHLRLRINARVLAYSKDKKVKIPRNRPEGPEGGRGIALLILDLVTRREWVVSTTPPPLYPRERPGTHCTGGYVGHRSCLDLCEKSRPERVSIPGPSSPYPVAIPTELSRSHWPTVRIWKETSTPAFLPSQTKHVKHSQAFWWTLILTSRPYRKQDNPYRKADRLSADKFF